MPQPVPVETALVVQGPLRITVDEDGVARVKDRYVVSAPIAGSVARILLDTGDDVRQGEVLARILPLLPPLLDARERTSGEARVAAASAAQRQAAAQIERARAHAEYAHAEAARQRGLFERGSITQVQLEQALVGERTSAAELDSLRFAARVADYEVLMAKAALRRLSATGAAARGEQLDVPSPVTGRVLKLLQKSEGVVQAGTRLLEVGDPAALEVVVDVLTSDAVLIRPGAVVLIDGWGGTRLEGRVRRVEPSAFSRQSALGVEEQRVNVLVDLVSPHDQWALLGDGYRVEAHIVVWDSARAVQVPSSAVFRHDSTWAVYRVEGNRARLAQLAIGQSTGRTIEITGGLVPGMRVIVHPGDRVSQGVRVKER
jgi:HlyD family secretion protein